MLKCRVSGRWLKTAGCMCMASCVMFAAGSASAQNRVANGRYADDVSVVSVGDKLPYRSEVFPYPSQEDAVAHDDNSSFVIRLKNWETESATASTRFSTQFKYRYAWDNRAVIFRIEDVSSSFSVFVNGSQVGYSQNGAGRNEFDITGFVHDDYNDVEVVVYGAAVAQRIVAGRSQTPVEPRFASASVLTQPTVRIDDVFTDAVFDDKVAYLSIDVVTQSVLLNPKEYVVMYELFDPAGRSVARAQKILNTGMKSRDIVHFVAEIPDPEPWTHETPELYTLVVGSRYEGRNMEFLTFRTGLCQSRFENGQLYIGDYPVILRGVRCSAAENSSLTLEKLKRLKTEGYNCVVVDGKPQPDYFYGICDSIGMYVCDAADINTGMKTASMRAAENTSNNPEWLDTYLDRVKSMYYSSHLHPSVVMYAPAASSGNGYCMYESYMLLKGVSQKPVYYADATGYWNNDIETEQLFNEPSSGRSNGGTEVEMVRDADEAVITIRNGGDLKPISGTYKLTLKSGRKEIGKTMGELDLKAGETTEIRYALPSAPVAKGTLTIEISSKKRGGVPVSGGKLSDMYDIYTYNFKL